LHNIIDENAGANTIPCGTSKRTEEGLLLTPLKSTD